MDAFANKGIPFSQFLLHANVQATSSERADGSLTRKAQPTIYRGES
jgi:hypothetical protein